MERAYVQAYRELYATHWWWRAREALVLRVLRSLRPVRADRRILDVGCGDALFFPVLAEFGEVSGVEVDEQFVSEQGPFRQRIHVGPFDESFSPATRFDLILMLDVLEHLPDPQGALAHAASLLHPAGRLVITVPTFKMLWTSHDFWNQHRTRYTKHALRSQADAAGLQIENWFYCFHWMVAAKLLVRLKESLGWRSPGPPRLPVPRVNRAALRMTLLEQRILGPLRLPVGSSLLAVLSRRSSTEGASKVDSGRRRPLG